jgi:hypothetical protein
MTASEMIAKTKQLTWLHHVMAGSVIMAIGLAMIASVKIVKSGITHVVMNESDCHQ